MPPLDLDFKQGIRNCVESTIQPGSHKEITRVPYIHTSLRDVMATHIRSVFFIVSMMKKTETISEFWSA